MPQPPCPCPIIRREVAADLTRRTYSKMMIYVLYVKRLAIPDGAVVGGGGGGWGVGGRVTLACPSVLFPG